MNDQHSNGSQAQLDEFIKKVSGLPRFTIDYLTNEIPHDLLALPENAQVMLGSNMVSARWALEQFKRAIDPPERLNVFDAARLLRRNKIKPPPKYADEPIHWFEAEVFAGRLVFHYEGGSQIEPGEELLNFGMYDETTTRQELNAWLERIGHLKRIPDVETQVSAAPADVQGNASASPAARPEPVTVSAGDAEETPAERATRRLREFKELGGVIEISPGGVPIMKGRRGALQKLANRERAAGRPRSDRSDISKELKVEAQRQNKGHAG